MTVPGPRIFLLGLFIGHITSYMSLLGLFSFMVGITIGHVSGEDCLCEIGQVMSQKAQNGMEIAAQKIEETALIIKEKTEEGIDKFPQIFEEGKHFSMVRIQHSIN